MRTWLEVDFDRMKKNIDVVRGVLPEGCDIIAVVKANAYGHGDVVVAKKLREFGVHRFAVACMSEALILRNAGLDGEIIILGNTEGPDAVTAAENDITLACTGPANLKALAGYLAGSGKKLKVHLAVNTGMNRIGYDCRTQKELNAIAAAYMRYGKPNNSGLQITGIFSHFSSSDDTSEGADPYTRLQLSRFETVLDFLKEHGIDPGLRHISNSGGIGKYPEARFDAVRCGALIYGYNTAMDAKLPVEPVMQWKTAVTVIRQIDEGDAVSYSRKFIAEGPRTIATLGIGYADGLSRALSCKGYVLINGQKAPMIGNICMDQMMVDITDIEGPVEIGTEAVIIGRSGKLVQTADDIAEVQGSCMHEVLSTIGVRVGRCYK